MSEPERQSFPGLAPGLEVPRARARGLAPAFALLLVLGTACSTIRVETDYDPAADFAALETWAWLPDAPPTEGDPRVQNSLLDARVRAAVERELGAREFRALASGTPDFFVTYFAAVDRRIQVDTIYRGRAGPSWGGSGWSETVVNEYDQGSLILDVLDPRTRNLMWRGTASARLGTDTTPEARTRRINEAIAGLLARFPPPVSAR